jgi:hypothetical protein
LLAWKSESKSQLELKVVVVDVVRAAQSIEPSAQSRSWRGVGIEMGSLESQRKMGVVW